MQSYPNPRAPSVHGQHANAISQRNQATGYASHASVPRPHGSVQHMGMGAMRSQVPASHHGIDGPGAARPRTPASMHSSQRPVAGEPGQRMHRAQQQYQSVQQQTHTSMPTAQPSVEEMKLRSQQALEDYKQNHMTPLQLQQLKAQEEWFEKRAEAQKLPPAQTPQTQPQQQRVSSYPPPDHARQQKSDRQQNVPPQVNALQHTQQRVPSNHPSALIPSRYAVGNYVLCSGSPSGSPLPAIVRFVGFFAGAQRVGLEFMFAALPGCHDGFSEKANAGAFTCAPGKGCYLEEQDARLRLVTAEEAQEANWDNLLSAIGMKLEEVMEENVLTGVADNAGLEAILKAHGHISSVWVKRWCPGQSRYLYFDRTKPSAPGRVQAPPNACIAPTVEGGPEMAFTSSGIVAGPQLARIREGIVAPEEADAVLDFLINMPDAPLQVHVILPLVHQVAQLLSAMPSVARVPCPENGRVIVLGDTHGHWKDVAFAFKHFGTPSPTNVYVFNGDISDRADLAGERGGQQSVAIWCVLLCYKLAFPGAVFVNRGNHEDWPSNIEQGPYGKGSFHAEITRKYKNKQEATQVKNAFRELFYSLPLVTVIGDRVMCVHGGLSSVGFNGKGSHASLREIETLNRRRDIPAQPKQREECIMMDLLWSDPHDGVGLTPSPRGPQIKKFGGDVTRQVLNREKLALLIRSHDWPQQNKPHGHQWFQKGHEMGQLRLEGQGSVCLSVFTASDYCGTSGNHGALVLIHGRAGVAESIEVREWTAGQALQAWVGSKVHPSAAATQDVLSKQEEYMWGLKGLIVEKKHELFMAFRAKDLTHDFHVPISVWKDVCDQVCGEFPWEHLLGNVGADPSRSIAEVAMQGKGFEQQPYTSSFGQLSNVDGHGQPLVNYAQFLDRHQIRFRTSMGQFEGFRHYFTNMLFNSMMMQDQSLRDTIRAFDPDGDGVVTIEEFMEVISHVIPCISERQAAAMMRSTISNSRQGQINIHQLLDSFVLRFQSDNAKPVPVNGDWIVDKLHQVGKEIMEKQKAAIVNASTVRETTVSQLMHSFFIESDTDENGYLELPELKTALQKLQACANMSDSDLDLLCAYCDRNDDGRLNYLEFLAGFRIQHDHEMAEQVSEDLLESFFRVLYFVYRPFVVLALEQYIVPDSHKCTPAQFAAAIRTVNASQVCKI